MAETFTITNGNFTINLRDLGELVSPYIVTDNDNTEQKIGVNEVEDMISSALEDLPDEEQIGDIVTDRINYDYDFVTECDVTDIVRDYCDGEEFLTADMVCDVTEFECRMNECESAINKMGDIDRIREEISVMRAHMMSMQAEIDFLHEKHVENVERRIGYRVSNFVSNVRSLPARLWARVPKFTITRKDNNNDA